MCDCISAMCHSTGSLTYRPLHYYDFCINWLFVTDDSNDI